LSLCWYLDRPKSAGGIGLPLESGSMVLYEPNYNYVKDTQTIGRVQRLGQTHAVSVHFLGMTDRIDQRLQKTPLQKVYESRKYNTVGIGGCGYLQNEKG